ncbi:MAG: hypothetical protein AAB522_02845 [Patescibacteria group bacterium]|mgnify:CR=1 FL=1
MKKRLIMVLFAVIAICLIGQFILYQSTTVTAYAAKTDSCLALHEKALQAAAIGARVTKDYGYNASIVQSLALLSISHTLAYQNCRDLERRESR